MRTSSLALLLALASGSAAHGGEVARTPYDLCVFINGVSSPMSSMPEFWSTVEGMRKAIESSPGCRETVMFSASGDPEARDLQTNERDERGVIKMVVPPFSGLPATSAEIERVFLEHAPALARIKTARTFVMLEGHGMDGPTGGSFTLWREYLVPARLKELLAILPGQKVVFHDHCSAASMLDAYLKPSESPNEREDASAVSACALAISAKAEFALSDDGAPFVKGAAKGKSITAEADSVTSHSKLGVLPTRTSDVFLMKYPGAVESTYAPTSRELKELAERVSGQGFPRAAERIGKLSKLVRKNLDEISRPRGDTDLARARRLLDDFSGISKSARAGANTLHATWAQRRAFLRAKKPELYALWARGDASKAGDDSPEKREAETILSSINCGLPEFAAFAKEECSAENDFDDPSDWLQPNYRIVRRAYASAVQLAAFHEMVNAGDVAALKRVESFLECESGIGR